MHFLIFFTNFLKIFKISLAPRWVRPPGHPLGRAPKMFPLPILVEESCRRNVGEQMSCNRIKTSYAQYPLLSQLFSWYNFFVMLSLLQVNFVNIQNQPFKTKSIESNSFYVVSEVFISNSYRFGCTYNIVDEVKLF